MIAFSSALPSSLALLLNLTCLSFKLFVLTVFPKQPALEGIASFLDWEALAKSISRAHIFNGGLM